ncbi:hypothetical protein ACFIQG_21550 [Comamonas odontotermitis]|uniref:hypothetical protein n=1 Tax=Comamonas odontotermitis TaxID=379895 RepID=UPI003672265E
MVEPTPSSAPLMTAEEAATLWCVHLTGADDVHPMPSREVALEEANALNTSICRVKRQDVDPVLIAVVAKWPHSADSHAVGLMIRDECLRMRGDQAVAPAAVSGAVDALQVRIVELETQLAPYLEAEAAAKLRAEKRERAEEIVDFLFPAFNAVAARSNPSTKPPQWHEKSWWWNGVRIDWDGSDLGEGGSEFELNLSSYVGGGETEDIHIKLPAAWLTETNWKECAEAYRAERMKVRQRAETASKAAAAQRQIAEAQETLRRLEGGAA